MRCFTLFQMTNLHSSKLKVFADDNFKFDEMPETSPKGQKSPWKKEKLLFTSNYSFSHSVFKRLELQIRKNQGLLGKELNDVSSFQKAKKHCEKRRKHW